MQRILYLLLSRHPSNLAVLYVSIVSKVRKHIMWKRPIIVIAVLALLPAAFSQTADKNSRDRACLENYINRFLEEGNAYDEICILKQSDGRYTIHYDVVG